MVYHDSGSTFARLLVSPLNILLSTSQPRKKILFLVPSREQAPWRGFRPKELHIKTVLVVVENLVSRKLQNIL